MKTFTLPSHSIAVYTVLRVLCRMRARLGLEAMLEYLEKYVAMIEDHNPKLEGAVNEALAVISVEKMYWEAIK